MGLGLRATIGKSGSIERWIKELLVLIFMGFVDHKKINKKNYHWISQWYPVQI